MGYPGHFRLALEVGQSLGSEPFTSGVCSDSRWLVSEMNCKAPAGDESWGGVGTDTLYLASGGKNLSV